MCFVSVRRSTLPVTRQRGTEGKWRHTDTLYRPRVWTGIEWSPPRPGRFTPGKETRCPLYNRLGPVWTGPENLAPRGFETRTAKPLIESLYRLRQCFSTAGPRPSTGPWHQLYRAERGLRKLQYATRFY